MGGKSGGGGDISVDASEVFPGLVTPSFSLLRQRTPVVTRTVGVGQRGRRVRGQGGRNAVPNLVGGFRGRAQRTITTGGDATGPFELRRLGADPAVAEDEVIDALRVLRSSFGGLRGRVDEGRDELADIRSGIPAAFANTQSLRERNLALQEEVTPGFGRLTESQVREVRNREAREQGNLREALAARRVLGSSFASREQQSLAREFQEEEQSVRAESFLAEMETQQNLIEQAGQLVQLDQQTIATQGVLLGLEMGLTEQEAQLLGSEMATIKAETDVLALRTSRELQELSISGNIINGVISSATQLAGVQAQAAAERASGFGQVVGSLGGALIGGAFGKK